MSRAAARSAGIGRGRARGGRRHRAPTASCDAPARSQQLPGRHERRIGHARAPQHRGDLPDPLLARQRRDGCHGPAITDGLGDLEMGVGVGGDLRQVGHAQHLVVTRQPPEAAARPDRPTGRRCPHRPRRTRGWAWCRRPPAPVRWPARPATAHHPTRCGPAAEPAPRRWAPAGRSPRPRRRRRAPRRRASR